MQYEQHLFSPIDRHPKWIVNVLISALRGVRFYLWVALFVSKATHKKRLKQARKTFQLMNQEPFKTSPQKFFAYIRKIDAWTFEELLLLCFKARGFRVKHNHAYTGVIDGMVILPDKTRWAIQAKRYQQHINPKHVQAFAALIAQQSFDGGFFIHTGKTGGASYRKLIDEIQLVSGHKLHQFITGALPTYPIGVLWKN